MKKLSKILVLMIIIIIFMKNFASIADVIEIGDESIIERGNLGFYSIQYWNENEQTWKYITYSQTYYKDSEGNNRIAYCVNPELKGIGWISGEVSSSEVNIKEQLSDDRLWRIYKNGYPYVTPQILGVETEDDAYLATKQAAYFIIKGKSLEEVYSYFKAGDISINGQDVSETQRRGEKVLAAIYKLVDIGYNGDEKQSIVDIKSVGEFIKDKNADYYSRQYEINKTGYESNITIDNIDGMPEGTYISDLNGNAKNSFLSGESFKVMVPKENINNNYDGKIKYNIVSKSYPVYYAKTNNDNLQNYVVIANENKEIKSILNCKIDGYKSNIKVVKSDQDTNEPIKGVTFKFTRDDGTIIDTKETDENGEINITNILQGKINVLEIATNENYLLDETNKEITVGYGDTGVLKLTNQHKKGSLEIVKVDSDDNSKMLEGVEFDLIDEKEEILEHIITDKDGKAEVLNINTGNYILRESKTLEEYKIGVDKNIVINWNEVATIKIENEKKKGNIKLVKIDKDNNNIVLAGVQFQVLDSFDNVVEVLTTDKNGEVITSNLPIGKYYIREIKTSSDYVLNQEKVEIEIKDGETSYLEIENEKIKGKVKIVKTSEDKNNINNLEAGSPIANVKFEIYNEKGKVVSEVITNEDGIAESENLVKGKYIIKEIETGEWYLLNEKTFEAEIVNNKDEIEVEVKNKSVNPEVDVSKIGVLEAEKGQEIKYDFDIKNTGNVNLSEFTWYDFLPYQQGRVTKLSTGTYNQDLQYSIYYKTNKKSEYMVLKENLNTKENNYIDLSSIYLEEDEQIIELKAYFGDVNTGFKCEEKPYIYFKLNEQLQVGTQIKNETILEGWYKTYKQCDEAEVVTNIINKEILKKLPRTGF